MVLHFGDFRRKRSDECGFDDDTCVREWIQPRPFSFNQSPLPSAHFYDVPIDNFISMLNVICCQYAAEKKHMFHFASSSLIMIQFVIIAMILSFLSGASQYEKKINMNHFATLSVFFLHGIFFSLENLTIINASFLNNYSFVIQISYINLHD